MKAIEISSSNFKEYENLDIVGFSLAHAGAQGEGGCVKIVTSEGCLYHTNICHSIKLEEVFVICPPLRDCRFNIFKTSVPEGWIFFYMGGGNFLVVKELYKEILLNMSPNEQYWKWTDVLQKILKEEQGTNVASST